MNNVDVNFGVKVLEKLCLIIFNLKAKSFIRNIFELIKNSNKFGMKDSLVIANRLSNGIKTSICGL